MFYYRRLRRKIRKNRKIIKISGVFSLVLITAVMAGSLYKTHILDSSVPLLLKPIQTDGYIMDAFISDAPILTIASDYFTKSVKIVPGSRKILPVPDMPAVMEANAEDASQELDFSPIETAVDASVNSLRHPTASNIAVNDTATSNR